MVNTGHPSRACQACRAIKSKCDEGKPSCKRCARIGKPCVYLHNGPVFRSMNTWSEKTVKARVQTKIAAREAEEAQCLEKYISSPGRLVSMEWASHAAAPFFDRFVNQPDRFSSTWGFLTWLPQMYGDQSGSKYLLEATTACALANLANVSKIPQLDMLASRSYGLALRGLHLALSKPETAVSNDNLATMQLLALYEVISGTKPWKELFQAHLQGQSVAMRLRAKQRTLSNVDASIASHTNRWLLWRDLAERNETTLGLSHWAPGMYRSWLDELSASFTVRVADVCGRVRDMQERAAAYGRIDPDEGFVSCINTAVDLDQLFELSYASAPIDWLPVKGNSQSTVRSALHDRVPSSMLSNRECPILNWKIGRRDNIGKQYDFSHSTSNNEPYIPRVDTYPSRQIALLWNYMRGARLHLLRVMIDLRLMADERLDHDYCNLPSTSDLRTKLSDNIHDICGVFPFVIGNFYAGTAGAPQCPDISATDLVCSADAIITMWMMHKILAVPGISPSIRTWALGVYERIGTVGNIRQGLNLKILYRRSQSMLSPS